MPSEKFNQQIIQLIQAAKEAISQLFQQVEAYFSNPLANQIAGIDINSDFIKLLKITPTSQYFKIDHFAVLPLPQGAVVKNEIKNPDIIANVLKEAIRQCGMTTKIVALAVNRSATIIKNITVDNRLSIDEIESRVWIEANRLFPNLVSDIYLDFSIIGPSAQEASQLDVILVACRKEQMKPYLDIMRLTDLTPKVIDVNCYAFERALSIITTQHPDLKTIALLNIDFSLITLIVLQENTLIYTHELSYDGHSLLQQTQANTANQEEKPTTPDSATMATQNDLLMASISLHLRHTMQFFYSSRPHTNIQKIVLSGDCVVYSPSLTTFIQNEIGIPVILPDLFKNMTISSHIDKEKITYHAPQLILSCGLALSKLN